MKAFTMVVALLGGLAFASAASAGGGGCVGDKESAATTPITTPTIGS